IGMLQRNARFTTSAIAMHWSAQELICSTNFMSMSPANNVNLTARSSAKVQPFPPQPVVIASFQTAATFSRNNFQDANRETTILNFVFIGVYSWLFQRFSMPVRHSRD